MKKIYLLIILIQLTQFSYSQDLTKLNGYKYGLVEDISYEGQNINGADYKVQISDALRAFGIIPITNNEVFPDDLRNNPCLLINVTNYFYRGGNGMEPAYFSKLNFADCLGATITTIELRHQANYRGALKKTLSKLKPNTYIFNSELTPKIDLPEVENIQISVAELTKYFDSSKIDKIEGIYKTYKSESNYKLAIINDKGLYKAIVIEGAVKVTNQKQRNWYEGDVKAIFESTAVDGIYSTKFFLDDKTSKETFSNIEGGLLTIEFTDSNGEKADVNLLKLYPKK